MAEWRERVPVVVVRSGMGESEPKVFTGYSAKTDEGGSLCVFEVEPMEGLAAQPHQVKMKPFGHVFILANGTWEQVDQEWQVVGEVLRT